jgi:hypothetical protein
VTRATVLHRDRPDEDPAGAPSGLRWVWGSEMREWNLMCGSQYLGRVTRRFFGVGTHDAFSAHSSVYSGPSIAAAALVKEVRRG